MSELETFLKDTNRVDEVEDDVLTQSLTPEGGEEQKTEEPKTEEETGEEPPKTDAEQEEEPKNRRERRLQKKLEAERQSSIELAAKLEAMTGAKQTVDEADYLKGIERIYGTDSNGNPTTA